MTLPFWDETSDASTKSGIPSCLTDEFFELDGQQIANPLRSFVLPESISDIVGTTTYAKGAGYETVRYPLSGLVGTPEAQSATKAHNASWLDFPKRNTALNKNVVQWLTTTVPLEQDDGTIQYWGLIFSKFVHCLSAPNYTLFSNTTSMRANNADKSKPQVMALESPHNYIHLAVGGFELPGQGNASPIPNANGDMGENNTAGLDPIFFFHHCFIDYVFWQWQKRNDATKTFEIDKNDAGAKYGANNPPPAYADDASAITMDTPLKPFTLPGGGDVTSRDCIDIEGQMGYTFGPGSLDSVKAKEQQPGILKSAQPHRGKIAHVDEIDRQKVPGSMLIAIYGEVDGERCLLDVEPVLSRWNVQGCANCMTKLNVSSDTPLPESVDPASLAVELHTRAGLVGDGPSEQSAGLLNKAMLNEEVEPPRYKLTVH